MIMRHYRNQSFKKVFLSFELSRKSNHNDTAVANGIRQEEKKIPHKKRGFVKPGVLSIAILIYNIDKAEEWRPGH